MSFDVHERENNPESQVHLNRNRRRLSKQCKMIYKLMLQGQRVRFKELMLEYGVHSLPRRICDLKEYGIPVKSRFIHKDGKATVKEYWLTPEYIQRWKERRRLRNVNG